MVKWIVIAVSVLLVVGLGLAAFLLLRKNDSDIIKARLHEFAEKASKKGEESPLMAMGNAQASAKIFTDGCTLEVDTPAFSGNYSRADIAAHALAARSQFAQVAFSLYDIEVKLKGKLTASASFTVMLTGTLQSGETLREARDLSVLLVKTDGLWCVSSLKISSPIKK